MKDFNLRIRVSLKEGILDPEAEAIQSGLARLEFSQVQSVQRAKVFKIGLKAETPEQALDLGREMAQKLLVNLVMEDFEVEIEKE